MTRFKFQLKRLRFSREATPPRRPKRYRYAASKCRHLRKPPQEKKAGIVVLTYSARKGKPTEEKPVDKHVQRQTVEALKTRTDLQRTPHQQR